MDRRIALKNSALLMGAGFAGSVFSGMLNGCTVETSPDWIPSFLSEAENELVAAFSEHILPKTETPGAKDVFVNRFIDHLAGGCFTEEEKSDLKAGIASLDDQCKTLTGNSFLECNKNERDEFISSEEKVESNPDQYLWGNLIVSGGEPTFYRKLKGLVLFGYFSSETVGKEVLDYNPVPGKFVGCVPYEVA